MLFLPIFFIVKKSANIYHSIQDFPFFCMHYLPAYELIGRLDGRVLVGAPPE